MQPTKHRNPADRAAVTQWAQEMLSRNNVYILDTETTGTGKRDEVIQIGVVDTQGNTVIDTLVKANVKVSAGASRVNGITDAMLKDAPTFMDLYVQLSSMLAGGVLIAYNVDFDWRILEQTRKRSKLPALRPSLQFCAMKQYAQYRGTWNGKYRQYRWHKLTEAVAHEQLQVKDAHNALGDVRMTLALIQKMAAADV